MAEKRKPCEIYRRICDESGEVCFSQKDVYKWAKLFKGQNSIQDKDQARPCQAKLGKLTIANTHEMVYSLMALILAVRRLTTDKISEQQENFVGISHKFMYAYLSFLRSVVIEIPRENTAAKTRETTS